MEIVMRRPKRKHDNKYLSKEEHEKNSEKISMIIHIIV